MVFASQKVGTSIFIIISCSIYIYLHREVDSHCENRRELDKSWWSTFLQAEDLEFWPCEYQIHHIHHLSFPGLPESHHRCDSLVCLQNVNKRIPMIQKTKDSREDLISKNWWKKYTYLNYQIRNINYVLSRL